MAADHHHHEDSNPLLPNKIQTPSADNTDHQYASVEKKPSASPTHNRFDSWTADGVPLTHGSSVVGEPVGRVQWDSGLFSCLGRNDEFCSSDLEVCLLGSVAPCVLYGTNAERLGVESASGAFANHCLSYTGLYLLGNSLFGWNCLAPWFSYRSRTIVRKMFNLEYLQRYILEVVGQTSLEGTLAHRLQSQNQHPYHNNLHQHCGKPTTVAISLFLYPELLCFGNIARVSKGTCEALNRSCVCCRSCVEDEFQREHCESACDLATHICCHTCALCQEGREIRRRVPHPGFSAQPVLVMLPPGGQTMGREGV